MTDKKKSAMASRVLRFTVTGALVVAPLAACGGSSSETTTSTTPEGEVYTNSGPQPLDTNVGPQDPPPDPQPIEPEDPDREPRTNTGPNDD
jgi:hypothetical protein